MRDAVLVINTGSSSIKYAVYELGETNELSCSLHGQVQGIGIQALFTVTETETDQSTAMTPVALTATNHAEALEYILSWLTSHNRGLELIAVGHRVVHGGTHFTQATRIDTHVIRELQALIPLAPLHQPHALEAIEAMLEQQAQLPQVACFDTAFHTTMPRHEQHFALPPGYEQQGIRRYGFHGLSYEYIASVLPDYLGERANGKVVVAHLGHGVSMCAMHNRQSVATTMTFTPLDGLPMGKRCGAIDPAIVLYLLARGMTTDEVSDLLHHHSGLLGLSGISDDMHVLLSSPEAEAAEAVAYFCYRVRRELGALAAVLAGLDALVFTGGIGEHAVEVRQQICDGAAWLGIAFDADANRANATRISLDASKVPVLVIPTNEEHIIARHTLDMIHNT